jgi:TM2 domain-containing membrane protein YozV
MKKFCPLCGTENKEDAKFCKECNEPLFNPNANEINKEEDRKNQIQDKPERKVAMNNQPPKFYKNPSISTILSFFFMGLGQIYNGQIGKGILFIILYGISAALIFVGVGFITTPLLWIWGMVDANNSAKRINEKLANE